MSKMAAIQRCNGLLREGVSNSMFLFSQPSQEAVKEMIQLSKDTLEKIDKARSEGLYHEVRIHFYRDGVGKRAERFSSMGGTWGGVEMRRLPSRLFFWRIALGLDHESSCP